MAEFTSRISGFHKLDRAARLDTVSTACHLDRATVDGFAEASGVLGELADHLVENAIGTLNVPLGIATNMIVDGRDVLVPMATEESSVIAAVCNGARQCRQTGGIATSDTGALMIAQIEITGLPDPFAARARLHARTGEISALCNELDPVLAGLGGGFRELELRVLDTLNPVLVAHLIVDTRDAMGANTVNTMAEALAPDIERWTGGRVGLRILSNLADRRLVRATVHFTPDAIGGENVRDAIVAAGAFGVADPYRATTHNKGIMNGISAVALATGNDTRAIEAGAHAYAARSGRYSALSRWEVDANGRLAGSLELPLAMGIVGGATKLHPAARMALQILDVHSALELARIAGAVGLIQNFSALKALATEGIQRGHMGLHARNLALAAGARGGEVDKVAEALVAGGKVRAGIAAEILKGLRK